jgi:hypothetical protein
LLNSLYKTCWSFTVKKLEYRRFLFSLSRLRWICREGVNSQKMIVLLTSAYTFPSLRKYVLYLSGAGAHNARKHAYASIHVFIYINTQARAHSHTHTHTHKLKDYCNRCLFIQTEPKPNSKRWSSLTLSPPAVKTQ